MSKDIQDEEITQKKWKAVRGLLKEALLAEEIPLASMELRPKVVFEKYMGNPAFKDIPYGDKFTRILRLLRKKHMNGDLQNEDKPKVIEWSKSAAKQVLKQYFREGTISSNYQDAKLVWRDHCKDNSAFKRMQCDTAFVRRLKTVRDDYLKKVKRCQKDLEAFNIAKKNHPTPETNRRGEPQWNGSVAQQLLKELVKGEKHLEVEPHDIWISKGEYQVYSLQTFRDHIYQEQRLLKFQYYIGSLKKQKVETLQY
jgi:hypothetical protein